MPRRKKVHAVAAGLVLAIFVTAVSMRLFTNLVHPPLISDSPNRYYRVTVREAVPRFIDRNFTVVLTDNKSGSERVIFDSDDQSPTIKTERLLWTRDSSAVALVGDRYYAIPEARLDNGQIVFLVYDVQSGRLWCNGDEDPPKYPRISAKEAEKLFDGRLQP